MILLIEDEINLSDALVYMMKRNNYSVEVAYDGLTGESMAETNIYDLIILDRMLPGKNGIDILTSIRKKGINTPVLMLTAKDSIQDKIEGLDSGADDYLIKPFSKDELFARIRALGRRNVEFIKNDIICIGKIIFAPLKCEVIIGDDIVKLAGKEAQIFEYLIINKNLVVSKEMILSKIWGHKMDIEVNNIEVYLSNLRKKIISERSGLRIETIRGMGYCLKEINNT